jgi:polysaccharide biosynthesis/export protein
LKFKLFVLLFAILSISVYSQALPNYNERSFQIEKDSIPSLSILSEATSGPIDENEYIVGPGDILFISISGINEVTLNIPVDYEVNIYIPRVGGIALKNKSLSEARQLISERLNRYYKNVDIFISLAEFRRIKVSLLGDVVKPTTETLRSNARLLDLIRSSDGLTKTSNFRNITIKSVDGNLLQFDFLSFLRKGDYNHNPLLREGDVVIVDRSDKLVGIIGRVKFPANYEFLEGETVDQLIELAGGFIHKARKDSIELIRFNGDGKTQQSFYFSFESLKNNPVILKTGDLIAVREIPEFEVPRYVQIQGKVKYPGFYKIVKDSTRLRDLVEEAGGFLDDASLQNAFVERTEADSLLDPEFERLKLMPRADMTDDEYDYLKAKSRQIPGRVVVDFEKLFKQNVEAENIILKRNDYIYVPEEMNYIIMIGQLVNPGKVIYRPEYQVEDYIRLAGGFGWRALERDVRVIKVNTGEWIDADDIDRLDPGDTIWVPEDPPGPKFWDVFTTSLQVLGQVAAVIAATVAVIVATR